MAITETLRALGSWGIQLRTDTPDDVWKKIDYFGHIVVHVGKRINPELAEDSLLGSSRYTGVLNGISETSTQRTIGGYGMAAWLGDPDGKGDIFEDLIQFDNDNFQDVIAALLPVSGSVTAGTIFNVGETFSGGIQFQNPREAIDYVCQTLGLAWRVNGDATLDAGTEADLFVVDPRVVVVRKHGARGVASNDDMFLRALAGNPETARDVQDLTTRVLLMAQGSNGQFASATAEAAPGTFPFLDLHGNPIKLTRIVQESETDSGNAEARAQLQLNRFLGTRDALTLTSSNYDINGDARVGDYIYVYDPSMGLFDNANEEQFRGQRINPLKLRLTETTWPVTNGMSVAYRDYNGNWYDLTEWIIPESGDTAIVVGGYNRSLTDGGSSPFPVTPPETNTTIPGKTEWDEPFNQSVYQSPVSGDSRSEVELRWFRPDNTDSSSITDGDHWEIRHRTSTVPAFDVTFEDLPGFTFEDVNTWETPVTYPATEWTYAYAPWDVLRFRLQELLPSTPYEAQIRAVDTGRPPNIGEWSDVVVFQTSRDIIPPATPAAPTIASNPMAVQMTHYLGRSDGGQFNLDRDLNHLELHGSTDPLFQPVAQTLIGKVAANWGMITGEVPIVASFQITAQQPIFFKVVAIDESGNKSLPSASAEATAGLIDEEYISNLTVSKITAGTISADWLIAGYIRTAKQGARVEINYRGIQGYDSAGEQRLDWKNETGELNVVGDGGIRVTGGGNVEITDGALIVRNAAGNKIIEIGECTDGRHGVQVYRDSGVRVVRVGELASGSEGIELVNDLGDLVRVDTLAFGTKAASANTNQNCDNNNAAWISLPGGPNVNGVVIGNSGRCLISISAWLLAPGTTNASMSFGVNGPTVVSASSSTAIFAGGVNAGLGRTILISGLAPGTYNIAAQYQGTNGSETFAPIIGQRHLAVTPF